MSWFLDGKSWFKMAIVAALLAVLAVARWGRARPRRVAVLGSLTLAYGVVMTVMATGHLTAIAIKAALGTLRPLSWWAIPLGFALGVPALWLAINGVRLRSIESAAAKQTLILHGVMVLLLVPLGPSAFLALPAVLNIAWQLSSRPTVEKLALGLTTVAYTAMFVASFIVSF